MVATALQIERNRAKGKRFSQTPKGIYKILKRRVSLSGKPISSKEAFCNWFESVIKRCVYCKVKAEDLLPFRIKGKLISRLTIERRDNSKGYTVDNLVLACCICNTTRSNIFTETQMIEIGKVIAKIWKNV